MKPTNGICNQVRHYYSFTLIKTVIGEYLKLHHYFRMIENNCEKTIEILWLRLLLSIIWS